jgi:hypothetical protein
MAVKEQPPSGNACWKALNAGVCEDLPSSDSASYLLWLRLYMNWYEIWMRLDHRLLK